MDKILEELEALKERARSLTGSHLTEFGENIHRLAVEWLVATDDVEVCHNCGAACPNWPICDECGLVHTTTGVSLHECISENFDTGKCVLVKGHSGECLDDCGVEIET